MTPWDRLVGSERARALLSRAIDRGEVGHAYLFSGPEGVGKKTGALLFARALLCEAAAGRPCGECPSCRDAAGLRHEDLLVFLGDTTPLWHDPSALAVVAGLSPDDREGVLRLLDRLAEQGLLGRPVPVSGEKRRVWPLLFAKEALAAGESARAREANNLHARIDRLLDRGSLSEREARLARHVAVPPLSVVLYRRGVRGLGIASIAAREGRGDRSVKQFFERRPARGRRKIALVDEAHWMTEEAQNSFLKTLEEPPQDFTLILVTQSPASLLPTIRSRVASVAWSGPSSSEVEDLLASTTDYSEEERRVLAVASGGSPGRALRIEPSVFTARRALAIALLRASARGDLPSYIGLAARLHAGRASRDEERERIDDMIDTLYLYLRDLRAVRLLGHEAPLVNQDLREEIARDAAALPARFESTVSSRLADARARLHGFSEPRLVVEALFLPLFPDSPAPAGEPSVGARG